MKLIYSCLIVLIFHQMAFGDSMEINPSSNNTIITQQSIYTENPWIHSLKVTNNTQTNTDGIIKHLFCDGEWNAFGAVSMQYTGTQSSFTNYGYGVDLFAQTGQLYGFTFGGLIDIVNPFFATNINGNNPNTQAYFLPSQKQVAPSEAFVEYQYNNLLQVDAGLIGINNSPWLTPNYFNNMIATPYSYQGAMINVNINKNWTLTGIGFNGAQGISSSSFTGLTNYNTGYDFLSGIIANNTVTGASAGTIAVGLNGELFNHQNTIQIWGYNFANYGELLYANDNSKFTLNSDLSFNLNTQAGMDMSNGNANNINAINDPGNGLNGGSYGQISSNFLGIQGNITYKCYSLNVSYNNVWGNETGYGHGAIVSPYTYGMADDPLYTTPYIAGLVDMGSSGAAYKVGASINLLDKSLTISPSMTAFKTGVSQWNNTHEYDLITTYATPKIKGLNIFGVYAYQQNPPSNSSGNNYVIQIMLSYLY